MMAERVKETERIIYSISNNSGVQPLNSSLGVLFYFILFLGIITSIGGSGDPIERRSKGEGSCQAV
jgi:hypothetical protein